MLRYFFSSNPNKTFSFTAPSISKLKQYNRPPLIPLNHSLYRHHSTQPYTNPPSLDYPNSPSSEFYDYFIDKCEDSSTLSDAKQLHLNLYKHGFNVDLFLCNSLISLYAKFGHMGLAYNVFDEMPLRNSVSWACLISGYTQNGMPMEACWVFQMMVSEGFLPNRFALGSALRACPSLLLVGLRLGMQLHGLILKSGCTDDLVLCNVLITMYGSCLGRIDDARRVFDEIKTRSLVSCNAIISVYSQRKDADSAFEIFSSLQREDSGFSFKPNEYTFGSLVTAAHSSVDSGANLLEQMLTRVIKSGLLSDLYVGSAFVGGFSRHGLFDNARKIFEQMTTRSAVTMNGLMAGVLKQKRGEEAAEIFIEMRNLVGINLDSYVILLSAFADFSLLEQGRRKGKEVHGFAIRTGLNYAKIAIGNGLINMYAKCGDIEHAKTVFKLMVDKDSVSWNSMISGFDQNEYFHDALASYQAMRTELMPSNFTLISALSSCASLGWVSLGKQIHGEVLKVGLDSDVSVSNALLSIYASTGHLATCQKFFSLMQDIDQISWNTIIGEFANSDLSVPRAIEFFLEMMRAGWTPNRVTYINTLAAAASLSLSELNRQLHALMLKHHATNDTAIENALLAGYGKCGQMDDCEKIFSRMSDRRDEISWNSMISGYIHNDSLPKAMALVWLMMQRGQQLDGFTFATVLSACASVATLGRGMEVHACAVRACLESDVVVGSALVDMYSKCGRIDYASRFFDLMPVRSVYSWNSMISGYARHGHGDNALKLFTKMKLDGQLPDHVTFVGVLSACSHVGLVEEGYKYFASMTEVYGLTPRIEHYSCMVDLLGRAGELDKLESFINTMPIAPNILIWRTVLGACCRANGRRSELGRKAAEMLFDMEPQNAVNYVLLSNMYALGGKWEDMRNARNAMRKAAVKKEAGCSWVTMKDGVHVFVAGDQSHPENELIYKKLKEINQKIRDAGYIPEVKFSLRDLEQEAQEELLSYHSEKLAVAFVLTRNSTMPIRIMKNLRVCGDCHNAFKYISNIAGRSIVLRDSNRFHHFENGQCSCVDFW